MKIYVAHSRSFDFENELYAPILKSALAKEHEFIFPHIASAEPFSSKELFQNGCDLILAEVTYPATGLGIELGWADMLGVPVVCLLKEGAKISGSLKVISKKFLEYTDTDDLIAKISEGIGSK